VFKRRKLGIWPNPPQISAILKPVFFSLQNATISKLFFFPSWKCGDLSFFGKFSKMLASPCMFSWGTFQRTFVTKNKKSKNEINCFAPLCVSLLV
jgi:hypothetical protein